jgi:hypothetical protein
MFRVSAPMGELSHLKAIPGVGLYPGLVTCGWDVAWRVAELLGQPCPAPPADVQAFGMERYDLLGFREVLRVYQKNAALFLLRCAWAILALPMRTGKSLCALAAAVALGAERVLIVSPGGPKYTWVDEVAKWCKERAVWLEGRGGREARRYCLDCSGTGRGADGDWCQACKQLNGQSYGYQIIEVRTVSRPVRPEPVVSEMRTTAPWRPSQGVRVNLLRSARMGPRHPRPAEVRALKTELTAASPPLYRCSIHEDVTSTNPNHYCVRCRERLLEVLASARFIIANYEIMGAQDLYTEEGGLLGERLDLPGWAPILGRLRFDLAIMDEARMLRRGARFDKTRKGKNRRDRTAQAIRRVQRVWGLEGTPVGGYTRDVYGPLDVLSGGLFGTSRAFDERYCEGHTNAHGGWEADGRSLLAETELVRRLERCLHKRERSEILPELPRKQWTLTHVDAATPGTFDVSGPREVVFGRGLESTIDSKIPIAVENVIDQMAEGCCTFVLSYHPSSAEKFAALLEAEMRKPANAARLRSVNPQVWLAAGKSPEARSRMAKAFVQHAESKGGGTFVSTIGAMQGGVSLLGASYVHVLELHFDPDKLLQAVDRPNEVGITHGLVVEVYLVKGGYDEHVLTALGPKFKTQVLLTKDEGAQDAQRALIGEPESSEDIWRRLTAHLSSFKSDA